MWYPVPRLVFELGARDPKKDGVSRHSLYFPQLHIPYVYVRVGRYENFFNNNLPRPKR